MPLHSNLKSSFICFSKVSTSTFSFCTYNIPMAFIKLIPQKNNKHLIIYLLAFLLLSPSFTHCRKFPEFSDATMGRLNRDNEVKIIGSRPPRCEEKCKTCGHCEAIQIPIVPSKEKKISHFYASYSRGDDISNYKPMCWKCKCGDFIFNP